MLLIVAFFKDNTLISGTEIFSDTKYFHSGAEYLPIMFILFQLILKTMNQKYFLKVLPLNQVSAE